MEASDVTNHVVEDLTTGNISWDQAKQLIRLDPKDNDRFWKYLAVLQSRVKWKEKILLRISEHLYVVAKGKDRIVKCDCGHEFGDYRVNWKLKSRIYVRSTPEEMAEVYSIDVSAPETRLVELREYYCPGCYSLLATEALPRGFPPFFEMLPDLDALYREWLGRPLPDENPDWFQDKTLELAAEWGRGGARA